MAITTKAKCKDFRGIPTATTEHDAELDRIIPAVQEFLERECERVFEKSTVTEYYSGLEWRDRLIVAQPPIVTITNIWDDLARSYATPLASSLYVIEDANAGLIKLDGVTFQEGLRNIKITYEGGFTTIPEDLEQAAIELVWAAREKGLSNLVGVRSRSVADGNVQYVNLAWGSLAEDILRKYRLHTGVA